jgi:uncharacterized protein involved in exopolysaccharide biosynthesis
VTKYLELLFRYKIRFVLIGLLAPLVLSGLMIVLFPSSQAHASLWVDTPNYFGVSPTVTSGWNQYLTPAQNTADQMGQLIRTGAFARQLDNQLVASGAYADPSDRSDTMANLATDLKVAQSGSHLVIITYTCRRAALCVKVISVTIDIYRQSLADQRQAQSTAAINFYNGQLAEAQRKLKADQDTLNRYTNSHPGLHFQDAPSVPEFQAMIQAVTTDQTDVQNLQGKLDGIKFQASASTDVNNAIFTVIDSPTAGGGRISNLPKRQLAIVWVGCLGATIAWLVVLAWLDRTARDPKEIERRLQVPVVAQIPIMSPTERF